MIVQIHFDSREYDDCVLLNRLFGENLPVDAKAVDVTPDATPEPEPEAEKPAPKKRPRRKKKTAEPKAEEKAPEPAPEAPAAPTGDEIKVEDLRTAFSAFVQAQGTPVGLKTLNDLGAKRLSDLPKEKYGELMAIINAG